MPAMSAIERFRRDLHGRFIQADDQGYDDLRKVWNGLIDKRPALIAQCADESDVVHALNLARNDNLLVAVRGGGHNVAGFSTCDDGIVIDLSTMKGITVDAAARTARAQGGVTWGDFDKATQAHALATTGGLVSTTGIAGFTLGGGVGWLIRKYGLTIDNLLAVEMITADGRRVTASAEENPDLFWGVRGGGGNFGIVTAFTYRLHPVGPNVFGGVVLYPFAKARDLLCFYREWVRTLPDELTTMIAFLTAPPAPFIPQHLQGTPVVAVALCYAGPLEQGDAVIRPLRDFAPPAMEHVGAVPYVALQGMLDATAPKGILAYWKAEYLRELGDGVVDALVEQAGKMGAPFAQVHIHHIEGAISRVSADATAFGHRDAPFILNILGMWMDAAETRRHVAWARESFQAVQPYSTGRPYLNFLGDEGEARIRAAYGDRKYARLVELKNKYDPNNLFRLNQNIRPSK
jgi:FAD/FMN-containing dehydrogenase